MARSSDRHRGHRNPLPPSRRAPACVHVLALKLGRQRILTSLLGKPGFRLTQIAAVEQEARVAAAAIPLAGPQTDPRVPAHPIRVNTQCLQEPNNRFVERTEIHPNRIVFHDADEMRRLQGVGRELKEQKIVDHRPKRTDMGVPVEPRLTSGSATLAATETVTTVNLEAKP